MREDKKKVLKAVLPAIQMTRAGADVEKLELITEPYEGEHVAIHYIHGHVSYINVAGDSGADIIIDVVRALL